MRRIVWGAACLLAAAGAGAETVEWARTPRPRQTASSSLI